MFIRFVQSALVGMGCCLVSIPLLIMAWQFYIRHMIHTEPGLGAVAGGIAPSLLVFAIVFLAGFAWNWRITRQ
jgi:hypothetical protein